MTYTHKNLYFHLFRCSIWLSFLLDRKMTGLCAYQYLERLHGTNVRQNRGNSKGQIIGSSIPSQHLIHHHTASTAGTCDRVVLRLILSFAPPIRVGVSPPARGKASTTVPADRSSFLLVCGTLLSKGLSHTSNSDWGTGASTPPNPTLWTNQCYQQHGPRTRRTRSAPT